MRNVLLLALSALVLFVAGSGWLALYPGVPRDLGGAPDLDREAVRVRIPVDGDDALDGWLLRGSRPGVIVLLHGYARDHHREWRYARALRQDGWTILAVDFRSSRARDRKPTTLGWWETRDARATLDWVRSRPLLRAQPVGLFGESLGGSVAIVAAAARRDVAAVALDSPFADGRDAMDDSFRFEAHVPGWFGTPIARLAGRVLTRHDPAALDALAALRAWAPRPLLLVQAGVEDRFGRAQAARVAGAAGPAAETWLVEDAGHNRAWEVHPAEYERRMRGFFVRHLTAVTRAARADAEPHGGVAKRGEGGVSAEVRIGTQGWSYDDWKGVFYPPGAKQEDRLPFYAEIFDTVELDTTFYHAPRGSIARSWARHTPDHFRFAAKLPRAITHEARLREAGGMLQEFARALEPLGGKLGPLLVQTPADFARDPGTLADLGAFLAAAPAGLRLALEFRSATWHDDAVFDLLRRHGAALAWTEWRDLARRTEVTADFLYLRWLGDRREIGRYDRVQVDRTASFDAWEADLARALPEVREVYGYFNNHWAGHSPASANEMKRRLGLAWVAPPDRWRQRGLFD